MCASITQYTALLYSRVDGRLESKRVPLSGRTARERRDEARKIAAEYEARLVSIDKAEEVQS